MYGNWDVRELLADPHFRALLGASERTCLTWEEFLGMPQPAGMSPLETWGLLSDVGQCLAVPVPIPDLDDNPRWYRRTHEIDNAAHVIACACRPVSQLNQDMNAMAGQHFRVKSRIDETIAAAQLDGLAISQTEAEVLLRLDRTPQTAAERLLVNTFAALDHLPDLIGDSFSREMFWSLHDLLLEGVDQSALHRQPPLNGTVLGRGPDDPEKQKRLAGRQMDYMAAYLNRESSDPGDLPVLQALLIADVMRYCRPLGIVSSQVGRLAARLFALKNDLPVLGLLPVSRAKVDWETGIIAPPKVCCDQPTYAAIRAHSASDVTPTLTLAAQLTLIALKDLQLYIDSWKRRDAEMRDILLKDPLVNHRQRSILARALRNPDAEFRIRYHQRNHNIHYATARRDLLELEAKGYLVMEQRGRAFVFSRGPRLDELEALRASR